MRGKKAKMIRSWIMEKLEESETGSLLPIVKYNDIPFTFKVPDHDNPGEYKIAEWGLKRRIMEPCIRLVIKQHKKMYKHLMKTGT